SPSLRRRRRGSRNGVRRPVPEDQRVTVSRSTQNLRRSMMRNSLLKMSLAAGITLAAIATAGPALSAACPEGKGGVDVRAPDSTPASGVTDTVVGMVDLSKEPAHIDGRL